MKLLDIIRLSDGPYYVMYGRFNVDRNKHEFAGEVFKTKDDIPLYLLSRTVTYIGGKSGDAGLGLLIKL